MKTHIIAMLTVLLILAGASSTAGATIYFYYDAEDGVVGASLPDRPSGGGPVLHPGGSGFSYRTGTVESGGGAPRGTKYLQWQTFDGQQDAWNDFFDRDTFPIVCSQGTTYYLAFFFNFTRVGGNDIWHDQVLDSSFDKAIEIDGNGVRWVLNFGHWGQDSGLAPNQDHRFTVFMTNPTYHLNPALETALHGAFNQNRNGYGLANPIQLEYERWHSAIMAVNMAADATGWIAFYINGVEVGRYDGIRTSADTAATITEGKINGTIGQNANDAPAHLRRFDALMITDDWQDIVDGGYLGSPGGGNTVPPAAPTNLTVQ